MDETNIWVTSDLHLGHDRDFLWGVRGFNSIQEHDKAIIENWNSVVRPHDHVYVLGDVILGDIEHGIECVKQLNGHLYLAPGNHETFNKLERYATEELFEDIQMAYRFKYSKRKSFYMCHYPTITDNTERDFIKTWNLCGHTHTNDPWLEVKTRGIAAYHCEMEAHNNFPVNLEEIIANIVLGI